MSSLAGKMSLLVDEYNHSKTSPAYRKLSIKYKALKKSNQELIQLLTSLFAGSVNHDNIRRTSRRSQTHADRTHADRTHAYQDDILEESQSDEEMEATFVPYDLPQNNTDYVEEEGERDLESCRDEESESEDEESESEDEEGEADCDEEGEAEDEEGEADCDEEEETEDPDIKEQIIQEQVAESFAIKEEEYPTITVEEEVIEYEEVEEEETEEVVEEEVVEYEEVEEEEEEEAGVYEIEVNGTRYYTTNEKDGIVYALLEDDDVGDEVGKFVNGKLVLN